MTDSRTTPDPKLVTENTPAQVISPVVDLLREPGGDKDRQVLYGDHINILSRMDSGALIRSKKDGYCGWLASTDVGVQTTPTHRVTVRSTHIYSRPDIKSPDIASLSFSSALTAIAETATFIETTQGFVPRQHVHPIGTTANDPAAIAEIFLGTPYLWGGNSHLGIDCSGLVQAACLACAIPCPGDSDQQAGSLGHSLDETTSLARNDLIFWKGHVALVSDTKTLIHANAGHMSVVFEGIDEAIARIERQGDGLPTHRKRLPAPSTP